MHNALEGYRYYLADERKLKAIPYGELQSIGKSLRGRFGFTFPLTGNRGLLEDNVARCLVELDLALNPAKAKENGLNSNFAAPPVIAKKNNRKRHYPIVVSPCPVQSFFCYSSEFGKDLIGIIERFFRLEHETQPTVTLYWSKPR